MKKLKSLPRQWAIFYNSPTGKTYACITRLGCNALSLSEVNIYCDLEKLKEAYQEVVQLANRQKEADKTDVRAYYEGVLKPEYRGGKVFIARFGSPRFPVTLLKTPYFQSEASGTWEDMQAAPKVWALRVPCVFNPVLK